MPTLNDHLSASHSINIYSPHDYLLWHNHDCDGCKVRQRQKRGNLSQTMQQLNTLMHSHQTRSGFNVVVVLVIAF